MPDGQDICILAKLVEHCFEQAAREHRCAQIVDAGCIDGVMRCTVCFAGAHRHREVELQALANLSPLFAGNIKQLLLVILRQITFKTAMALIIEGPVGRGGIAAQFDGRAGLSHGQFLSSAAQ